MKSSTVTSSASLEPLSSNPSTIKEKFSFELNVHYGNVTIRPNLLVLHNKTSELTCSLKQLVFSYSAEFEFNFDLNVLTGPEYILKLILKVILLFLHLYKTVLCKHLTQLLLSSFSAIKI